MQSREKKVSYYIGYMTNDYQKERVGSDVRSPGSQSLLLVLVSFTATYRLDHPKMPEQNLG